MSTITSVLEHMGLNDKEAEIYVALLSVGTAPASTLSKRTSIVKSTAHFTCQQLVKKGLARVARRGNLYLFTAEPPDKLLLVLDNRRKEIEKREEEVKTIVGTLKEMMHPQSSLPKVQYFEGQSGMIDLYESILDMKQPIDSFEDKGEMNKFIPEYIPKFIKKRLQRGIFNRVICASDNAINVHTPKELREVRTLKTADFPFSCDIKICGDQVSIFSFQKETAVGISIVHKEIAENFRVLFNAFWIMLGSLPK